MSRYLIEEIKYGQGEGGFACGPCEAPYVAEMKDFIDAIENDKILVILLLFTLCYCNIVGVYSNYFRT